MNRLLNCAIVELLRKKITIKQSSNKTICSGYSLIETLVVIAIFGITISLVTTSYLTFERNQRFRNSAAQIKSDLRFTQNKALTGDKGFKTTDSVCPKNSLLVGWYFMTRVDTNPTVNTESPTYKEYSIGGACKTGASADVTYNLRDYDLPKGVYICEIRYGGVPQAAGNTYYVLFRSLASNAVTFHGSFAAGMPPFINVASGNLRNVLGSVGPPYTQSTFTIRLARVNQETCGAIDTYEVTIVQSGEIKEAKL